VVIFCKCDYMCRLQLICFCVILRFYCIGFITIIYLCAVVLSNVTYLKCEMPIMKTQMNNRNYFFFPMHMTHYLFYRVFR